MATENTFVQPSIPKFDGHYDHWAMLMENFLRSKEYWSLVETGISVASAGTTPTKVQQRQIDEQKLKDLKAKNYLFQALDRSILETILKKDTAKDIWDSMKKKYQGSTRVKRAQLQALRKEFETLHMKAGETVNDYFARTLMIANKMKANGENKSDTEVVEKILRSMTPKFNYVVCSIEEAQDTSRLSIDELQSSLLVHEQRMISPEEEQALKVTYGESSNRGRGRSGYRGRGRGRGRANFDKSTVECFNCHKLGHFQWECQSKESNHTEISEEMLLMARVGDEQLQSDDWFLDSGCSNHMCNRKEYFADLNEQFADNVKLGNNAILVVKGKGNVRLQINNQIQVITEVFYVPDLKNNLLSVGQLQEKGLAVLIQHNSCKVYHPERGVIMKSAMSSNRMFKIVAVSLASGTTCFNTITEDVGQLWHCRYGHLSFNGLNTLQQKEMVVGLPQLIKPSRVCKDCLNGKQQRDPFPKKSAWRAELPLQLIHSDLCGPIQPISNSNKRYFLSFIDDCTRKTWIYFLHEKSEAFKFFKEFKAKAEREVGLKIKGLRTDRGGEFTSSEFSNFCVENGIKRQLTAPYSPQQNGVAERKNRTIMNMVRSMMIAKNIPKSFWPEAVNWAVHVLNRSPTLAVQNKTPEEAWSGEKPSVGYFKVFGCVAHVHVGHNSRNKLDKRSVTCVLLGVSEESKAYRLYNPIDRKIIVSRDVKFEEDGCWNWGEEFRSSIQSELDWNDNESDTEVDNDQVEEIEEDEEGSTQQDEVTRQEEASEQQLPRRQHTQPSWMQDYVTGEGLSDDDFESHLTIGSGNDPVHYDEAEKDPIWRKAMKEEIEAIERNGTWYLTELPGGAKKIGVKWIFKTKRDEKGDVSKYKARLVVWGYTQEYGVDYKEVFAPVARMETIRLVIAVAAHHGWSIYQLDVKSAFLHGELTEDVFVEQPQGFEKKGEEGKVYKLNRALYGLKQAPRAWYSRIESYFLSHGFEKCEYEPTLFTKVEENNITVVSLYVDDLIYTGNDDELMMEFKKSMQSEFAMTDMGKMKFFLGLEATQKADGIFVCQKKYVIDLLERFGMSNSNSAHNPMVPGCKLGKDEDGKGVNKTLYKQMVGSLMYATATRPDIMYSVSQVSRFMENPKELHFQAVKRIIRYLKGTCEFGLFYQRNGGKDLIGYTDSDYANDIEDRKSTSGYVFMMSEAAISWSSKKQPVVSLSTTEAEFIAAAASSCQAVWIRRILEAVGRNQTSPTVIYCDNSSTIKLSKNPVMHGRSKHIDVRFHFLRDLTKNETVELKHCSSQEQVADVMTKALKLEDFVRMRRKLGVVANVN